MPLIIPFYIMNRGCPHRCIFCNEEKAVGPYPEEITEEQFQNTVLSHLQSVKKTPDDIQIAFYGGNFTGLAQKEQIRLLEYAMLPIRRGWVHSVRISTRPDDIDKDRLALLKKYRVQTIEIGAQSMVDDVLSKAERGHTAGDVEKAVQLIKSSGFEVGIHLMAGLPGENREHFEYSVEKVIFLQPHMVRIHPTIVFADTPLAKCYHDGSYDPLNLFDAVDLCKFALRRFEQAHIPVIRIGLQTTPEMEKQGSIVAGPYHPAFRSLVEASIFFDMASSLLSIRPVRDQNVVFSTAWSDVNHFRGQKNENLVHLKDRFRLKGIFIAADPKQEKGTLRMAIHG